MRLLAGRSIALRLAASSLFWSSLILLVAGIILTTLYRQASERALDQRLLVYANDLAADLVTPGDRPGSEVPGLGDPRFAIPLSGWYWQVGRLDARPRDIQSSRSLLGNALPLLAEPGANRRFGEIRKDYVTGPEERQLRMVERDIDLGEDGRFVVRVAGPTDEISEEQARFVGAVVLTFLLLGVALGLTTLLQIRFGLRPLIDLRRAVGAVRRGQTERISGRYPQDIAPLADELNLLLEANREILERARTQVGNLAHALKTPLSIIVNEADGTKDDLSDHVREQAAIMRHQVDYYLNRARAAALAGTLGAVTDVAPVLDGLARTFDKIYRERGLAIEVKAGAELQFPGERQDLEEMAGNLIDNACKWAASRVEVTAQMAERDGRPILCILVDDDGPGLPEPARAEVVKRGRRLDETKPGSGLGLSIVADLAGHYRGRLELGVSGLGGVRAHLELLGAAE
ncbi:MAG TPA: ATP-binding protein [Enterovirga sp.]|jgi:signal transduction histidine kinase